MKDDIYMNPELQPKLLHKEELDWKGTRHQLELYESEVLPQGFINQCQAIPFVDNDHIVLFRHIDGYYGLPGGTVEDGEDFYQTLKREVMEESACEVLRCGLIGYVKDTELLTGKIKYQLRYWTEVLPLEQAVEDPDGKAIEREIVDFNKSVELLKWGGRWQVLFNLARDKYLNRKIS